MRVEHLAIDGSLVSVEADADLSSDVTAAGWAMVPAMMRAHPFASFPAGHSSRLEDAVRSDRADVQVGPAEEYAMKGGTLRVAQVELPAATGGARVLTVGAWEGQYGCLTTSISRAHPASLVEVFDTLDFDESRRGLRIKSRVLPQPRPPEVLKEIPGVGLLNIRPATSTELEACPRARGALARHGELFRIRATSNALMFITATAVVRVDPLAGSDPNQMVGVVEGLNVEWAPRGALVHA
ncbi:MAG: hypothetical protein ACRD0F_08005 [Acidimicrobiales bacterium]